MTDAAQLNLLSVPREAAYQVKSATSREQAKRIRPKAGSQRARVLAYLEGTPQGATMHVIAAALRIPLSSVCGRMNELKESQLTEETGETRETPNGGRAAVWKATP